MGLVILPQALKLVIPGIVNTFIALFKDTTLVLIIGLFDILGTLQSVLADQLGPMFQPKVSCLLASLLDFHLYNVALQHPFGTEVGYDPTGLTISTSLRNSYVQ